MFKHAVKYDVLWDSQKHGLNVRRMKCKDVVAVGMLHIPGCNLYLPDCFTIILRNDHTYERRKLGISDCVVIICIGCC